MDGKKNPEALVILIHYRLAHGGGLERRLLIYMNWLHQQEYQVELWVAKADPTISLPEGVKVRIIRPGIWPNPFRKWAFHQKIKRALRGISADLILSLGRQYSTQVVLDPGNHLAYMEGMGIRRPSIKDQLSLVMDQEIFQNTPLILAASEYIRTYTIRLGAAPERVKVLHPPLDVSKFNHDLRKERAQLRAQKGFSSADHISVFVSFSHKRKGLDVLLAAFRQMEDRFKLLIIGQSVSRSLPANVQSVGVQEDLPSWYTLADLCVHPARMEPFGQVIAESLACG
ncbi:MAG: glycosyltransferase family 4 protein, partial [Bacteroidota bacterium]